MDIPLGTGGGVACGRCAAVAPEAFRPAAEIVADLGRAADSWAGGPGPNVVLSGPEPYRFPGLPSLVEAARSRGIKRLSLATDAAALADPANASGSVSAGIRHIRVTLLAGSPEAHNALLGRQGAFAASQAGMEAFREAASALGVPFTICGLIRVCSHNVKDLPGAVMAFAPARAASVTLSVDPRVSSALLRQWVPAAVQTGIVNGMWVAVEGVPAESLGLPALHDIDPMAVEALVGSDVS